MMPFYCTVYGTKVQLLSLTSSVYEPRNNSLLLISISLIYSAGNHFFSEAGRQVSSVNSG